MEGCIIEQFSNSCEETGRLDMRAAYEDCSASKLRYQLRNRVKNRERKQGRKYEYLILEKDSQSEAHQKRARAQEAFQKNHQ